MKIWMVINSGALLLTATFLYLTIRQVGLILGRMGPMGARPMEAGPRIGENIMPLFGTEGRFGDSQKPTLYIFGSDSCGVCKHVKPAVESLLKYWNSKSNIIMIYDGDAKNGQSPSGSDTESVPLIRRNDLRQKLGINFVPFGMMVNSQGVVLGKGLVNEISHVESLLELSAN